MGWVSYFEDNFERLQEQINHTEALLQDDTSATDARLKSALSVVQEAKGLLGVIRDFLDTATSPEVDLVYERDRLQREVSGLQDQLAASRQQVERLKADAVMQSARWEKAKQHTSQVTKEKRRAEKKFEEMAHKNFGAAVDVYSSPGMIRKHKPNA